MFSREPAQHGTSRRGHHLRGRVVVNESGPTARGRPASQCEWRSAPANNSTEDTLQTAATLIKKATVRIKNFFFLNSTQQLSEHHTVHVQLVYTLHLKTELCMKIKQEVNFAIN